MNLSGIRQFVIATGFLIFGGVFSEGTAFPAGSPAAINGQLSVCGRKLCNVHGNPIQLRGMSTHGLQWYKSCVNNRSLKALAKNWKADVLRLSLYVQEGGYASNPKRFTRIVDRLIKKASRFGLYVIVDWHMLDPGDPFANLQLAKTFFTAIAKRHADRTNILYEVANEPNGDAVTWLRLKSYHQQIIPVIRKRDRDAVILLGTRAWSSFGVAAGADETEIVRNPVAAKNIMYTFHFYAASHGTEYLEVLSRAAKRIPVFVTEFGTQQAHGDGPNDFVLSNAYLALMKREKISWANWNYSDDHRSGAVFVPGTCPKGKFAGGGKLKEAGAWIRTQMRSKDRFSTK